MCRWVLVLQGSYTAQVTLGHIDEGGPAAGCEQEIGPPRVLVEGIQHPPVVRPVTTESKKFHVDWTRANILLTIGY